MQDSLNRFLSSRIYKRLLTQKQFLLSSKSKSKSVTMTSKTKSYSEKNTLTIPTNDDTSPIIRNASSYNKIRQQYGLMDE